MLCYFWKATFLIFFSSHCNLAFDPYFTYIFLANAAKSIFLVLLAPALWTLTYSCILDLGACALEMSQISKAALDFSASRTGSYFLSQLLRSEPWCFPLLNLINKNSFYFFLWVFFELNSFSAFFIGSCLIKVTWFFPRTASGLLFGVPRALLHLVFLL